MKLHFRSVIEIYGANPYVLVTASQSEKLKAGWKRPMPVLSQINKQPNPPWKVNMMPTGDGSFYLYLHGNVRKASNTKVGDTVDVDVSFDTSYTPGPIHTMPPSFRLALTKNPEAKSRWDALIPSRKKELLRYFSALKSESVLAQNVEKAISVLSGEPIRFMGRDWKNGS